MPAVGHELIGNLRTGHRQRQALATSFGTHLRAHPFATARADHATLGARGFSTPESAERYLRGELEGPHDPLDLPNIETALTRIATAIRSDELIAVFGDYDVDGVTGTAILVEGIASLAVG